MGQFLPRLLITSLNFILFFIFWVNLMAKLVTSQWRNGHFQNKIKFGGQKIEHLKLVVVTLHVGRGWTI